MSWGRMRIFHKLVLAGQNATPLSNPHGGINKTGIPGNALLNSEKVIAAFSNSPRINTPAKPEYGISLALMAFVEFAKFTECQLCRL